MELLSNVKLLNFMRRVMLDDTENILPYSPAQKPKPQFETGTPLPRCTPYEAGVSCEPLLDFYEALANTALAEPHACILVKDGKVYSEAYWAPYTPADWHVTHSMCKTVTATAIGFLYDEKQLQLDLPIASIFPERCGLFTSRRVRSITVRHLLAMRSGSTFREPGSMVESDWLKAFFDADVSFEPGAQFEYNSMNTYVLACIVKRLTGLGVLEYLQPRLFKPLGFGATAWETCPNGIEKGGWGMYVHLEDMVKLGQLYLQKGRWTVEGESLQLLSEGWVQQATTLTAVHASGEGYGLHLWVTPDSDVYAFNGMFGQYVVVAPSLQMVIGINAGASNVFTQSSTQQAIVALLAAVAQQPSLAPQEALQEKLFYATTHFASGEKLSLPPAPLPWHKKLLQTLFSPAPAASTALPSQALALDGKSFAFAPNHIGLLPLVVNYMAGLFPKGITQLRFIVRNERLILCWHGAQESAELPLGFGTFHRFALSWNDTIYTIGAKAAFATDEDDHLVLKVRVAFVESSSVRMLKIVFLSEDKILLKLDEAPQVDFVWQLLEGNTPSGISLRTDLFKDLDYFNYRIEKLCTPCLVGTATHASANTPPVEDAVRSEA